MLLGGLRRSRRRRRGRLLAADVAAEGPGRGELAKLVPDHVLGDVDRHVAAPVVDRHGMPHHLREDRAGPAPCADDLLLPALVHLLDLLEELGLDERTLLQRTRHRVLPSRPRRLSFCDCGANGAVECRGRTSCYGASGSPESACPRATWAPAGRSAGGPRPRRAGDHAATWPSRAPSDGSPGDACGRPCPA